MEHEKRIFRKTPHPTQKSSKELTPKHEHIKKSTARIRTQSMLLTSPSSHRKLQDFSTRQKHGGSIVHINDFPQYEVHDILAYQGWLSIFSLKNKAYALPMDWFYANLYMNDLPNNLNSFHSRFIQDLEISPEIISDILNCPNVGVRITNQTITNFKHYPENEDATSAAITLFNDPLKRDCSSIYELTEQARIIAHILSNNIIPAIKEKGAFPGFHLLIVYCLIKRIKVNLPYLIITLMFNTYSLDVPLCYGKLITLILAENGVLLEKHSFDSIEEDEPITATYLIHHQIILPNDVNPHSSPSQDPLDKPITKREFKIFRKENTSLLKEIISYLKRINNSPTSSSPPPYKT